MAPALPEAAAQKYEKTEMVRSPNMMKRILRKKEDKDQNRLVISPAQQRAVLEYSLKAKSQFHVAVVIYLTDIITTDFFLCEVENYQQNRSSIFSILCDEKIPYSSKIVT